MVPEQLPQSRPSSMNIRFGRFRVRMDRSFRVTGAAASIDDVALYEFDLRANRSDPSAIWTDRLVRIGETGSAASVGRSRLLRSLEVDAPLLHAMLFRNRRLASLVHLEAIAAYGHVAVLFAAEGGESDEAIMLGAVRALSAAYQPADTTVTVPTHNVFSTHRGFVEVPPTRMEEVELRLERDAPETRIGLETLVVPTVEPHSMVESWGNVMVEWPEVQPSVTVVRSRPRSAAGLSGEELVVATVDEGSQFTWRFTGVANDPVRPQVTIEMETAQQPGDALLNAWDDLLNSLGRAEP